MESNRVFSRGSHGFLYIKGGVHFCFFSFKKLRFFSSNFRGTLRGHVESWLRPWHWRVVRRSWLSFGPLQKFLSLAVFTGGHQRETRGFPGLDQVWIYKAGLFFSSCDFWNGFYHTYGDKTMEFINSNEGFGRLTFSLLVGSLVLEGDSLQAEDRFISQLIHFSSPN